MRLRREAMIPMPSYRRLSSMIGLCLVVILMATGVDAVIWSYRAQQRFWRAEAAETLRQALDRRQAAERALEAAQLADPMGQAYWIEEPALLLDMRSRLILCNPHDPLCQVEVDINPGWTIAVSSGEP